jgi:hypothetical protein
VNELIRLVLRPAGRVRQRQKIRLPALGTGLQVVLAAVKAEPATRARAATDRAVMSLAELRIIVLFLLGSPEPHFDQ